MSKDMDIYLETYARFYEEVQYYHKKVIKNVARVLTTQLEPLLALTPRELIARRQARFRKF